MVKVGNLIDHAIKNDKIDIEKNSSKSKENGSFPRKKEGKTQALFQGYHPNQSRGTLRTKTMQIINLITRLRVIKHPW